MQQGEAYQNDGQYDAVDDVTGSRSDKHTDITVCDEASAERCPIFPGITKRLHWSFPGPSSVQGAHDEKLAKTREVRDTVKQKIEQWCEEVCGAEVC